MAHAFYGVNLGQTEEQVVEGASTNSTDIELNVDLSKITKKSDVLLLAEKILRRVVKDLEHIWG